MDPTPSTSRSFNDYIPPPEVLEVQPQSLNLDYLKSDEVWNRKPKSRRHQDTVYGPDTYVTDAELCQAFERDPSLIVNTVQTVFFKRTIVALGKHVSHKTAQKICVIMFSALWLNDAIIDYFYASFFPMYLQREYSWFTLDLLKRAYAVRPRVFLQFFSRHLLRTVKIPKQVLQDFVVNLKVSDRNNFMKAVMDVTLTPDQFVHNLQIINLLFLDSEKSSTMCVFVVNNLERFAPYCYNNRDFGRLLLSLLKNMDESDVNQRTLKLLIDSHGSEFKGPCESYLDDLIGELVELQFRMDEQPRILIPRPNESYRTP